MTKALTELGVEKLRAKGKEFWIWDAAQPALVLKVKRGAKTWAVRTKFPGRSAATARTLGTWPNLTVAGARALAARWLAQGRDGVDPVAVEAEARRQREAAAQAAADRAANTFASVAEAYISQRRNRHAARDAAEIRRALVAEWGARPIGVITAKDVKLLFAKLIARGPYTASSIWDHANGVFRYAVYNELLDVSPTASLSKRLVFANVRLAPRSRVLSDDELRAFWKACKRLAYPAGDELRLLLLTACRRQEVADAQWSELHPALRAILRQAGGKPIDWTAVDDGCKTLVIPASRFKSGVDHTVQLSDAACAILAGLPRLFDSPYLFCVRQTGQPFALGGGRVKRELDALMLSYLRALARMRGEDPTPVRLAGWVLHDLRRSCRTGLSALGIADHIAEQCLGHARTGLQRVYDLHRYGGEVRHALELWAGHLQGLVGPGAAPAPATTNVVPLRGATA